MSVGIRHDDLRRRNRAMVISAARASGQPSRTEIAGITALSHSTISAISADLIDEGILKVVKGSEQVTARRGRPQVSLALNPDAATVATLVLSLNLMAASIIDYSGRVIAEETCELHTLAMSRMELVDESVAMLRRVMERTNTPSPKPLRIVFAIQGITDAHARTMLWSPITPHGDIPFADVMEREFGVPTTVENDCNMMAVALRWRNPDRYRGDFIAILLSSGIGMGLVLKGELFTGTQSSGGEFGHMIHRPDGALCRCGRRGCVEAYAGSYAIWRNARGIGEDQEPEEDVSNAEMNAVADRARAADGPERQAYAKAGNAIGFGIGSLFALIDPAPITFVGAGAAAFDILEPEIRDAISRTAGGQHSKAISFDTETDELPLIREGCAMRALIYADEEIFATGITGPAYGASARVA